MALETLSSNELLNFIIYDTICATPFSCNDISEPTLTNNPCTTFFHLHNPNSNSNPNPKPNLFSQQLSGTASIEVLSSKPSLTSATAKMSSSMAPVHSYNCSTGNDPENNYGAKTNNQNLGVQKKKRRRRPRVCKNKEEAENQRMTHIAVERNRRKQINEHLAVLRSLMPESYVQRGDQASIVGGAIEFVKELEHLLQSLEAQKFLSIQQQREEKESEHHEKSLTKLSSSSSVAAAAATPPFAQFFTYPQYTCSQLPNKYTSKSKAAIADIEVTLIETHASLRILSQKRLAQLSKLVSCFQTMHLSVLHLNVTTLDPLVLYSISLKVEEGCRLNSADEIAGVVHQMLRIIEEEPTLCVVHSKN